MASMTTSKLPLPPQAERALNVLHGAGYEAWIVGGAVRDFLTGRAAQDWDIATDALPEQMKPLFAECPVIPTGEKHGTVTVLMDGLPLEITTFRVDGEYSDHRHPDGVRFTRSLREDLARRDFTMNALAYDPRYGICDPFGGADDIRAGIVRCVGDPGRRFEEDALRILRALRFASVFGMGVEADTAGAIHRDRELLTGVAPERVQTELTKLLCGRGAVAVLHAFADVIAVPLPELAPMFGFNQRNPHHDRDVWEHTLAVVDAIPAQDTLRWAALLHDAGKPDSFTADEDGTGHFYGHGERSVELARAVAERLRFDTARKEKLLTLVRWHDLPVTAERNAVLRLLNRFGEEGARALLHLHRADTLGQAPMCRERLSLYDRAETLMDGLLAERACFSLRDLAVNGQDLLALGLSGPAVGRGLKDCLSAVMDGRVPNEREALMRYLQGT